MPRNFSSFPWPKFQMKNLCTWAQWWLMLLGFQKFRVKLIHEDAHIWWCKLSSYSSSLNLLFFFSINYKIIIFKHKFSQLNKIVSGDLIRLFFLGLLLLLWNQPLILDTRIQSYSICSGKYWAFWKVLYLFNVSQKVPWILDVWPTAFHKRFQMVI